MWCRWLRRSRSPPGSVLEPVEAGRRLYVRDATTRSDGYGRIAGVAVFGACIILFAIVCRGGLAGRATEQSISAYRRPPAADLNVAAELARSTGQSTGKDGFILTDAPGIAFSSGREVPPLLVDSSLKRIDNHYLATDEVEREVERHQVKAVLLWTGWLNVCRLCAGWIRTSPLGAGTGPGLSCTCVPSSLVG
jgi:hypothetical protein